MSKTRRDNGEGCFWFDEKRKSYQFKVTLESGDRKTFTGKTKEECREKFKNYNSTDFARLCDAWLTSKKALVKPSTLAEYENKINCYFTKLFHRQTKEMTEFFWQQFINDLTVSRRTKAYLIFIIRSIWYHSGMIPPKILLPRDYQKKERFLLDFDERARVEIAFDDPTCGDAWRLIYYTGLRVGECAALEEGDFRNSMLHVNKTVAYVRGKRTIQTPKSRNSIRRIPLPPDLWSLVEGKLPFKCSYHNLMIKFRQKTGINIHFLRHDFISRLLHSGVDIATISSIAGDVPETIVRTYIHTSEESCLTAMRTVAEHFRSEKPAPDID